MGYFSNLTIDYLGDYEDHSYPSPERQLLWRLDDLKDRMKELISEGTAYRNGYIYSENDIRYALPEHLCDIYKVERAIELAKEDLLNKYGINVYEVEETGTTEENTSEYDNEEVYEQITLIDIILPAILSQNKAAA